MVCDVRIGEELLQMKDRNSLDLPSGTDIKIHLPPSRCIAVQYSDKENSPNKNIGTVETTPIEAINQSASGGANRALDEEHSDK